MNPLLSHAFLVIGSRRREHAWVNEVAVLGKMIMAADLSRS